MAVPAGTYKARFTFDLGTPPVEQAVFGFHLRNADTASQATTDALATHVGAAWDGHSSALKPFFGPHVVLKTIDVYGLDATNHTTTKSTLTYPASGTGSWIGSGTNSLPWECAPVVSLHGYTTGSFVPAARRKRGRMYLPPVAISKISNSDGILNNTDVDTIRSTVQAVLEAVNDIPAGLSSQARVVILSLAGGFNTDVQDVVSTSTIHSQRRRERSQPINHTSVGTLTP